MSQSKQQKRISPTILARARELRRPLTPQEQKLWQRLRSKQLCNLKFRRQHPIGRFVLDFYCPKHKLVVEIDGDSHAEPEQERYDEGRTQWLNQQGLHVVRFSNREIDANLEGVLERIASSCGVEFGP